MHSAVHMCTAIGQCNLITLAKFYNQGLGRMQSCHHHKGPFIITPTLLIPHPVPKLWHLLMSSFTLYHLQSEATEVIKISYFHSANVLELCSTYCWVVFHCMDTTIYLIVHLLKDIELLLVIGHYKSAHNSCFCGANTEALPLSHNPDGPKHLCIVVPHNCFHFSLG